MLLILLQYWGLLGVWNVFYIRLIGIGLTIPLFFLFFGPKIIQILHSLKVGQTIRVEDCPPLARLHEKKKSVPTMGGILILGSVIITAFLWMDIRQPLFWLLIGETVGFGLLGFCDDYLKMKKRNSKGLGAWKKFSAQVFLSLVAVFYLFWVSKPEEGFTHFSLNYGIPFVNKGFVLKGIIGLGFALLFSLFVIVGSSNAVNLTDGLDGLAAGTLFLAFTVLSIGAFYGETNFFYNLIGAKEIGLYLLAQALACLAFLWFNSYPAQIFMGDTGSLALGGMLGICAVFLRKEFLLALVGAIFVVEALSVILQVLNFKIRKGKRIFLCAPLHHHFEYKGISEPKIVVRFWLLGLALGLLGIISLIEG